MREEDKPLPAEMFLQELQTLFKNEPKFVKLINHYFAGNQKNWKDGDRADKIITTLREGYAGEKTWDKDFR